MSKSEYKDKIPFKMLLEIFEYMNQNGNSIISVKRLRNFHKIDSTDRSRINFYWRWLRFLREKGFIKKFDKNGKYILKKRLEEEDLEKLFCLKYGES